MHEHQTPDTRRTKTIKPSTKAMSQSACLSGGAGASFTMSPVASERRRDDRAPLPRRCVFPFLKDPVRTAIRAHTVSTTRERRCLEHARFDTLETAWLSQEICGLREGLAAL